MNLGVDGKLKLAVKLAFLAGAGAASATRAVYAEDAPAPSSDGVVQVKAVQVTGSRIKQPNLTASSSITAISDEEFQQQGTVNVETLINNLPQAFAEYSSNDSNGATGTATVDLRGLGSERTLVLVDGKRLMPGDPLLGPQADLNFIPVALIDRVDILSGGASAVYGSDAVAGVVNFVMKKDFEGFRIDSQLSRTDHSDGTTYDTTLIWGSNFAGGKGNVTLYAGYTKMEAVTQAQRDFSSCSLKTPSSGTSHVCAGSRVIPDGRIFSYDRYYSGLDYYGIVDPSGSRSIVADDGQTFNYGPYNYLQRPSSRYTLGGFAHDQINEHVDLFGSAMFMDNHTVAQIAPSGLFGQRVTVPCSSPLLSSEEQQFLCTDAGLASTDDATVAILKRTTEVGPRQDDLRHTDFRIVVGARGDINDTWSYEASAQRGEVIYSESYLNDVSVSRAADALNVTTDSSGNIVCASGNPGCVPLDIWQVGQITPAQANYIRGVGVTQGDVIEQVATGTLTGDLGKYGLISPLAKDGVSLAGGWEYRTESLHLLPDFEFQTADLAGQGGASPPVDGAYQVNEAFGELQVPVIQNAPFAKQLQVDGAYRWSNYSLANDAHSWKVGLKWQPVNDLTFRGSYQRALRAPSIQELFSPSSYGLFGGSDPCSGTTPAAKESDCARTGVAPAGSPNTGHGVYGNIADCNSGQCNALYGGNTALKPEESITRSIGLVLTPSFIKNFTATIDYYNITVSQAINSAPQVILTQCIYGGDPTYCSYVNRGPTGRLSGDTSNGYNYVDAPLINTSVFKTKGIDFDLNYRIKVQDLGLGPHGSVAFRYVATYLDSYQQELGAGTGVYDCAGLYGITCGTPNPTYRHTFRATWYAPEGYSLSANWRYYGGVSLDKNTSDPNLKLGLPDYIDNRIGSKQYLDLSGTYTLPTQARNITLRAGVNNVTGQKPPTVSSNNPNPISAPPFGNGNTFPNVYDSLGRVMFVGVQADF